MNCAEQPEPLPVVSGGPGAWWIGTGEQDPSGTPCIDLDLGSGELDPSGTPSKEEEADHLTK